MVQKDFFKVSLKQENNIQKGDFVLIQYRAWFDGSFRGNGHGEIGYIIKDINDFEFYKYSKEVAAVDSIAAEYIALVELLKTIKLLKLTNVQIFGDCQFVINSIRSDKYKRPIRHCKWHRSVALGIISSIDGMSRNSVFWTKRKNNKEADQLSKSSWKVKELAMGKIIIS